MTSLTLSKQLADAGFAVETEHWWVYECWDCDKVYKEHPHPALANYNPGKQGCPAYTTDTLLGALPCMIDQFAHEIVLKKFPCGSGGYKYEAYRCCEDRTMVKADTPSNALAMLTLRLIEEGII